jgi:hypothetical protein
MYRVVAVQGAVVVWCGVASVCETHAGPFIMWNFGISIRKNGTPFYAVLLKKKSAYFFFFLKMYFWRIILAKLLLV